MGIWKKMKGIIGITEAIAVPVAKTVAPKPVADAIEAGFAVEHLAEAQAEAVKQVIPKKKDKPK